MSNIEYDLTYLRAAVASLKDYLLSKQLFWPIGLPSPPDHPPYPGLTLGNLLLTQSRLESLVQEGTPAAESLNMLGAEIKEIKHRWLSHWQQKIGWESTSRLNQWRNFLEEYRRNPASQSAFYPTEVRVRVILEQLQAETGVMPDEEGQLLAALDTLLRGVFQPGEFVWDAEVLPAFPPDPYWYLYGTISAGS